MAPPRPSSSSSSSSSPSSAATSSPCAACKFLRRKCTQGCVFAPYFPPEQPTKFSNVHRVFGASNVAKLLNELHAAHREDAVNSLAYEAEARLHDPIYGCVGYISLLQQKLKQLQVDLYNARKELSTYLDFPSYPQPSSFDLPRQDGALLQEQLLRLHQPEIVPLEGTRTYDHGAPPGRTLVQLDPPVNSSTLPPAKLDDSEVTFQKDDGAHRKIVSG